MNNKCGEDINPDDNMPYQPDSIGISCRALILTECQKRCNYRFHILHHLSPKKHYNSSSDESINISDFRSEKCSPVYDQSPSLRPLDPSLTFQTSARTDAWDRPGGTTSDSG